jgi:hypothetical protein
VRRLAAAGLAAAALVLGGCHAAAGAGAGSPASAPGSAAGADPAGSATLDGIERQLDGIEQGIDADGRS